MIFIGKTIKMLLKLFETMILHRLVVTLSTHSNCEFLIYIEEKENLCAINIYHIHVDVSCVSVFHCAITA